jgi:hypothetical protein
MTKYSKFVKQLEAGQTNINYTEFRQSFLESEQFRIAGKQEPDLSALRKKYHDIEFGLLNSIVKNGDGKTCQTAWLVIQVTEEYFIPNMLGAKLLKQSIDNTGGLCDKMEVQTAGGNRTYYFEISKVMEGYKKRGIN